MRVAIHQPNYFPWMGYFNKIAKSDLFILLDEVQMTDSSTTQRNRLLNKNGKISFITVAYEKKDYLNKSIAEIKLNQSVDWQKRQYNFLWDTYHKFPTWNEVYPAISPVFEEKYDFLCMVNLSSIRILCDLLEIKTPIKHMSEIPYDRNKSKNDLVLDLCKSVGADTYLSGNGARKYMQLDAFFKRGITVEFQTFEHPIYPQKYAQNGPVLGLSLLDVLFNLGLEETKRLFWDNIQKNEMPACV